MPTNRITVAIADDHSLVRSWFRRLLSSLDDVEVLGEAASAQEALDLVRHVDVDVLLLDHSMPGWTGLDVLPAIRAAAPRTQVVMVSSNPAERMRHRALRAGAFEFVEKFTSLDLMFDSIRAAAKAARLPFPGSA